MNIELSKLCLDIISADGKRICLNCAIKQVVKSDEFEKIFYEILPKEEVEGYSCSSCGAYLGEI